MSEKHYVYSARTTEKGLAIINKAKGKRSWDSFVNEAVAEHYKLNLKTLTLVSPHLAEREAKRKAKEAEAKKPAKRITKAAGKPKTSVESKPAEQMAAATQAQTETVE